MTSEMQMERRIEAKVVLFYLIVPFGSIRKVQHLAAFAIWEGFF